jgi:hypothetical protein
MNTRKVPNLLIVLGNTSSTFFAVLASQWHPDHTVYTEVLLVIIPFLEKLIDDGLLLAETRKPGNIARIVDH